MAEEVNYASVVFKSTKQAPPEAKKEEETVYDEVKVKSETTEQTADTNDEKENNKRRRYQKLTCCLGILCVILLVGLVAVFVVLATLSGEKNETTLLAEIRNLTNLNDKLNVDNDNLRREHNNLTVELSNLTNLNDKLSVDNDNLRREHNNLTVELSNLTNLNDKLSVDNDNLRMERNNLTVELSNLTKNYIVVENNMTNMTTQNQDLQNQMNNLTQQIQDMEKNWNEHNITRAQWSIDTYCRKDKNGERQCTACRKGWLPNKNNCYVYHTAVSDRITWEEAREDCRGNNADLAVAHTKEEKDIINDYSKKWGFWIGLKVEEGSWKWIDGTELSDSSWIGEPTEGHCAVSVKDKPWRSALCGDKKRWICVQEALSV